MKQCPSCSHLFQSESWECPACTHQPLTDPGIPLLAPEVDTSADYPEDAFEEWAAFERANHFWFQPRATLLARLARKCFPDSSSFLEVGCGAGSVWHRVSQDPDYVRVTGGDPSVSALRMAKGRGGNGSLVQLDALNLPYFDEFDVVGAFDVLEHLEDDHLALTQMSRAAIPGGGIIVSVPQHPWMWSQEDDFAGHKRRYTRSGLKRLMQGCGLEVIKITSFAMTPLPALALVRKIKPADPEFNPIRSGAEPKRFAGLLERILNLEAKAIVSGASLPFGSSLVAVGRCAPD